MLKYIIKRILWIIPVTLGVLFLVFTINHFSSGDPVLQIVGSNYTQEQYDAVEKELGLDKPFLTQYVEYVWGLVTRLDFGTSYFNKLPVRDEILARVPTTLKFGLISVCITILIGIPLGVISATHQYSAIDYIATCTSLTFAAIPAFWLALMLMLVFALNLKWLPATGIESWKSWILPCISLGVAPISSVTRMTRSSMLEVIRQDYIRTALAKGLSERVVTYRHALKNALIPIITVIGMQMGIIFSGSVIIESIFAIPGMGTLMYNAIGNRDYTTTQGCVVFLSVCISLMNLVVDIVYAFVDPRIRAQYSSKKKSKKAEEIPEERDGGTNA